MGLKRNACTYTLLLFFVCMLFPFYALASSLIFVHLGKPIPSCILTTIKQARYLNPDSELYLLLDDETYSIFKNTKLDFINKERISLINIYLIPKSSEHLEFCEVNKLPASLEKGFWIYARQRFFTLYDFIKAQGLTDILHLESIPCFLFIKDTESLSYLYCETLSFFVL